MSFKHSLRCEANTKVVVKNLKYLFNDRASHYEICEKEFQMNDNIFLYETK